MTYTDVMTDERRQAVARVVTGRQSYTAAVKRWVVVVADDIDGPTVVAVTVTDSDSGGEL